MKKLLIVLLILLAVYLPFSTPELTVRTNTFLLGSPINALTSEVTEVAHPAVNEGRIYSIKPGAYEEATNTQLDQFWVKKYFFWYTAEYYSGI